MKVVFDRIALSELDDAIEYYDLQVPGLGVRFKNEVSRGLKRIISYPDAWKIEKGDVRRYLLHKFPFKILYSIEPDHIYVIAIASCHRKPEYWIDRLIEE